MLRTHTCGELKKSDVAKEVRLAGWVNSIRNHGGLIFIDLRDRYGLVQVKFNPEDRPGLAAEATKLRQEWVVGVTGKVLARPAEMVNSKLPTGEIEVEALALEVFSAAKVLPFELNEEKSGEANEALRLKYRFLDLRRPKLQQMLATKDQFISYMRRYFQDRGFVEVQTPILANSSPEGARDFLVPSRLYPGKFYALPQAPQQFKQLLMVGGLDKYFQVAPCFRDEDPRMDRHYGEFYQLDMEMSFVEQDDVFKIMEPLMIQLTEKFSQKKIINLQPDGRFFRLSWREAMDRYGSDKPDLRFDLPITPLDACLASSGFSVFDNALAAQGVIRGFKIPGGASFSRREIDALIDLAKKKGLSGLSYLTIKQGEISSSLSKFVAPDKLATVVSELGGQEGDLIFIAADKWRLVSTALGAIRSDVAGKLGLKDKDKAAWLWIVDFPMYDYSDIEEGRIDFGHNPFSMPQGGLKALKEQAPLDILAYQYDLVLNGFEVSSGAIRNHEPEIMYEAFRIAGYSREEVDQRFGAMINAFSYGAPPHGGNAPGLDRLLMVLNDWDSIRDIYAFPKDGQGRDLMSDSPSEVYPAQLEDLSIGVIKKK